MMKVMLKKCCPFSSPDRIGRMDSRMDTAPRRPDPGEERDFLLVEIEGQQAEPNRQWARDKDQEDAQYDRRNVIELKSEGVARRPSMTNMMICASQVMPSWKRLIASFD